MLRSITNTKAFTLIETLIYLGVIAFVVTTFVSFGLAISQRGAKSYAVAEVNSNGLQAMEIITNKVKESDGVILPAKGLAGQSLRLDMPGTPDDLIFQIADGYLQLSQGGSPIVNLTSNFVAVTDFTAINNARNNAVDNITVRFTVSYRYPKSIEYTFSKSFVTTITGRK